MTESRYHELLGQLLDDALTEADAEELRRELEGDPDRLRNVREHLILSDLLGQEHTVRRGPEAFWRGVQSRLAGAVDGAADLDAPGARIHLAPPPRHGRRYWRLGMGIAAALLVSLVVATRRSGPPGARPGATRVSLRGEAVCTHCILHQTEECCPAVRVRKGGREETLFLSDNAVRRDFKRTRGCGRTPLPVLAEGTVLTEDGRPLLVATRLEVQR